jgi:hypothetical protein
MIVGAALLVSCAVTGWILLSAERRPLTDFEVLADAVDFVQEDG